MKVQEQSATKGDGPDEKVDDDGYMRPGRASLGRLNHPQGMARFGWARPRTIGGACGCFVRSQSARATMPKALQDRD